MTAAIDITTEQGKVLLGLLRRFIPGVVVWAYGSRAKWTARPNSDLDLIVFTTPRHRHLVSELKEALSDSNLPFLVDIQIWDEVPERFHEIIRKEYVVVQETKEKPQCSDPSGRWRETTWGDEISLEYGKALRGSDTVSGKFRVFGSNGPIGWTSQPLVSGSGVVLGRKGAYRGVQFSQFPFFVIDTAYYVVPKTELDMRWVYYAIIHYKLGEIDDGSPIPSTTWAAIYVRDLRVPSLPEQRAIAHILGTLDDKIELNRRMNETLEAIVRTLFQSWFVDFDPVRAKAEGRDTGLPREIAELFPATFQESAIGHTPLGWKAHSLYDTARFINGAAFKSEDFCTPGEGLPVVKIAELKDGISSQTKWSHRTAEQDQLIDTGDLLYSWSGSPDTPLNAFLWTKGPGLLNQHIFKVIAPSVGQKRFVYYLLKNLRPILVETAPNKQTTGLGHVTVADMKRLLVCLPTKDILTAFDQKIAHIFDKAFTNTMESQTLATLRDSLLPKLISGELRVKDPELMMEMS